MKKIFNQLDIEDKFGDNDEFEVIKVIKYGDIVTYIDVLQRSSVYPYKEGKKIRITSFHPIWNIEVVVKKCLCSSAGQSI